MPKRADSSSLVTHNSPKSAKPILVLIDSHAVIHRAYHALPDLTDPKGNPAGALYGLASMLLKLIKELKPEHIVAAYDLAGPTHRHEVYEDYKGTRAKTDDALIDQLDRSREIFEAFHIPIYEAKGFEADDIIGTLATKLKNDFDVIIASGDMDTAQLVDDVGVRVFTLRKGLNDTVLYDEAKVFERYGFAPQFIPDYKGFAGDASDNIIGISGIGEKTATKLIQAYGSVEDIYKALEKKPEEFKEKTGVSERIFNLLRDHQEEAEFSKVLATIRTDAPVTFDEEEAHWQKNFSTERTKKLFTELGFRSLVPRLESLGTVKSEGLAVVSDEDSVKSGREEQLSGESFEVTGSEEKSKSQNPTPNTSADSFIFKESAVALWLLHSETTNPSVEDVLNNTNSKTLEEAHEKLLRDLKKENLLEVYERIERPLIRVLDVVNANGILIDAPYLKKLSKEYHKELDALAKAIFKKAGKEFNINSPKQLGEVLFVHMGIKQARAKKTATGQLSTRESELLKLKDENPIIGEILAYRELQKLLSTYIDAIPPLLGEDGRLRTTFIQTGAATGRFASRDPNLQNIPIKTELGRRIRSGFVAPHGSQLLALDYSQIELRLAAILSGDEKLRDIFIRGEDVHTAVAAEVFAVAPGAVEYEMRRRAKVINFGILYGMGVNALREQLQTTREDAQAFMNRYFETFTGLEAYLTKTKATATRLGYTTTLYGRKRYFPGIKSKLPFVRASAERMAINAPMQGTQADMIKLAMVSIQERIERDFPDTVKMVLQIHDELIFEVKDDVLSAFTPVAKECMESVLSKEDAQGVPIIVSAEAGPSWGEMKSIEYPV